jgi:uncharacterized protein YndB with AHSA1/START domain
MWIVLAIIVVIFAAVLIAASTRPDSFRVQRAIVINAPPARVYGLLEDFDAWRGWSPWEDKDPAMTRSRSGPSMGVGATYAWEGNKAVGKGSMQIAQMQPPQRLLIKLDFISPFEGHNMAEFTLVDQGASTQLTWAMYGPSPFISKLMTTFISMDKMVGNDFQKGLERLKALAERGAA